jgi:hypothetical protein
MEATHLVPSTGPGAGILIALLGTELLGLDCGAMGRGKQAPKGPVERFQPSLRQLEPFVPSAVTLGTATCVVAGPAGELPAPLVAKVLALMASLQ